MGSQAASRSPSALDTPAGDLPLAVWPCANTSPQYQRAGRYLPASTAHPAKMAPELARRIVAEYSQPGQLVVDPMCGITTLVEAAALGRYAIGVEYEARRAELARATLTHAAGQGAPGGGRVLQGQAKAEPGRGVAKWHDRYGSDPAKLAHASLPALLAAMGAILAGCAAVLRPGGLVVLTARPWRRRELLVDFSGGLADVAEQAGLVAFERNAALLVGLTGDRLLPRSSCFQLDRVRKARARGLPLRILAHEDALVLRRLDPTAPASRTRSGQPQAPDGRSLSARSSATPAQQERPPRPGVRRVPGSYQHNPDPALAELLHTVCLEGWGNDSVGDLEEDGLAASLLLVEPAEQQELTDAFDQPVPAGNFIIHQDELGVVTVDQSPTPFHARRSFTALAASTGPGEEDATIMSTGPLGAWYGVGLGGRFLGEARDLEQALAMLRAAMDTEQVWPDIWFISDHGNPQRLDLDQP
jgi:modification methylase